MKEHRITQNDLYSAPEYKLVAKGFPFRAALNFALARIMSEKGIRYRHRTVMALESPELLPPYETWRDPLTLDIVIRQGEAGA